MTTELSIYPVVGTALFCTLDIPGYGVENFCDFNRSIMIEGVTYDGLGELLSITESSSELKTSNSEITITIGGVQNTNIATILGQKIKGSKISVMRGMFDPETGLLLSITNNPIGRFQGLVNNYALNESWDQQDATNTISLMCKSRIGILENKVSGRRTNGIDEKIFYSSDLSMDRVGAIAGSNYQFGAPRKG